MEDFIFFSFSFSGLLAQLEEIDREADKLKGSLSSSPPKQKGVFDDDGDENVRLKHFNIRIRYSMAASISRISVSTNIYHFRSSTTPRPSGPVPSRGHQSPPEGEGCWTSGPPRFEIHPIPPNCQTLIINNFTKAVDSLASSVNSASFVGSPLSRSGGGSGKRADLMRELFGGGGGGGS